MNYHFLVEFNLIGCYNKIIMDPKPVTIEEIGKNLVRFMRLMFSYGIVALIFWFTFPTIAVLSGHWLDKLFHFPRLFFPPLSVLISVLVIIHGISWMVGSWYSLWKIGKGHPNEVFGVAMAPPAKKLVVLGAFKYTRNPMAFGFLTVIFGLGILFGSISTTCIVAIVYTLIAVSYLKFWEENKLIQRFGPDYIVYKNQVPFLFPRLKFKL